MKLDKKITFFITSAIIIIGFIVYLGAKAIEHEVLSRENTSLQIAENRTQHINLIIKGLLEQKSTHIDAIAGFIDPTKQNIQHLLASEIDIKNAFVIEQQQIIYPDIHSSDIKSQQWQSLVDSIAYDPTVLFANYIENEQSKPKSGWYITYDNHGPVLIYWKNQNNQLIGFELSYVKLLLDLILELDNQGLSDQFLIKDNGQIIFDNNINAIQLSSAKSLTFMLDYPLKNWQINYYYQEQNNTIFYLLGGAILTMLIIFIGCVFIWSYREYTKTLRLAKQQVNFVGQVSHEFKTPLTNISLYSEMLKERLEDEPEPISDYLDIITQETQRLTRLIQNVLNFTKSAKINIKKIHLNDVINNVALVFSPALIQKGIQLNIQLYQGKDIIESDEDYIVQIINNLISNAEKYAVHGKQIDISLNQTNDHFYLSVRDYGSGIPNSSLSLIFKPFYRLNSSLNEGVSGTGIGLTIAKQLALQLQGDITVKNTQPGVEFTLILPIKINNKGVL